MLRFVVLIKAIAWWIIQTAVGGVRLNYAVDATAKQAATVR
jgi:hypothetical protein